MADELPELTEETLYCDASEVTYWTINTLTIDRKSALYRKLVNDSLPFYFINPYRHMYVTDNDGGWKNGVFLIGSKSKTDSYTSLNSEVGLTAIEWGIDQSSLKQMWAQSSEPPLSCGEPK